jgi:hypothetical protein
MTDKYNTPDWIKRHHVKLGGGTIDAAFFENGRRKYKYLEIITWIQSPKTGKGAMGNAANIPLIEGKSMLGYTGPGVDFEVCKALEEHGEATRVIFDNIKYFFKIKYHFDEIPIAE